MNGLGLYYQCENKTLVFGHFVDNKLCELLEKYEDTADVKFSKLRNYW